MYKNNSVRINLPEWMTIIWHESLFHTGARSRDTQDVKLLSYIWPCVLGSSRYGTKGSMDGVAHEIDNQVYCHDVINKIYKEFYIEN